MNNLTITGNVGNSELKKIAGNDLLEFSLAVKKEYSKEKESQWFNCQLWGKRATALSQYIVKGAGLAVSGEMLINYDPDKKTCYPKVNVNQVDIMKWAGDKPVSNVDNSQQNEFNGFQAVDGDDDIIPF